MDRNLGEYLSNRVISYVKKEDDIISDMKEEIIVMRKLLEKNGVYRCEIYNHSKKRCKNYRTFENLKRCTNCHSLCCYECYSTMYHASSVPSRKFQCDFCMGILIK